MCGVIYGEGCKSRDAETCIASDPTGAHGEGCGETYGDGCNEERTAKAAARIVVKYAATGHGEGLNMQPDMDTAHV